MRILVLPVGRCQFLEENESGLRFRRNKIWRFTECVTPYNRPSTIRPYQQNVLQHFYLLDTLVYKSTWSFEKGVCQDCSAVKLLLAVNFAIQLDLI